MCSDASTEFPTSSSPNFSNLPQLDRIASDGVRLGTLALLLFSITTLLTNLVLSRLLQVDAAKSTKNNQAAPSSTRKTAQIWISSHILFATLAFSTVFISSWPAGVILIAYLGIPWAVTLWIPFAIIGSDIAAAAAAASPSPPSPPAPIPIPNHKNELDDETTSDSDIDMTASERQNNTTSYDAANILAAHNVAISAPQILSAALCTCFFALARALARSEDEGVIWCMSLGGFAALGAAWVARGLVR